MEISHSVIHFTNPVRVCWMLSWPLSPPSSFFVEEYTWRPFWESRLTLVPSVLLCSYNFLNSLGWSFSKGWFSFSVHDVCCYPVVIYFCFSFSVLNRRLGQGGFWIVALELWFFDVDVGCIWGAWIARIWFFFSLEPLWYSTHCGLWRRESQLLLSLSIVEIVELLTNFGIEFWEVSPVSKFNSIV